MLIMNQLSKLIFAVAIFFMNVNAFAQRKNSPSQEPETRITTIDKKMLFAKQDTALVFSKRTSNNYPVIEVNDKKRYQKIDGFGYCLTGGSAQLLMKMEATERAKLLQNLFGTAGEAIGISYLRISIGASDLDDHVFSYDDLPDGETDADLTKFSIDNDRRTGLIAVLKEILAINPTIKILGSPWSPPVWMKTNHNAKGGSLLPLYYDSYANYFVKYIAAMKAEGVVIDAITVQNEPLHPGNVPSMLMIADSQLVFIRDHLGPLFKKQNIKTKIILYDHNCDRPDYPLTILNDPKARKYVDGSGFHLYGGKITALTDVHNAHRDKNIYFTEQWTGGPEKFSEDLIGNILNLIIGATRNWSRNVLQWNLASDPEYNPHTPGGCTSCMGAVTINGSEVTKNVAWYTIAHASKFVRPGSVRVESTTSESLRTTAFITPDKRHVLIVFSASAGIQHFNIKMKNKMAETQLPPFAVATYVW